MPLIAPFAISIAILLGQTTATPAYVREGDHVVAEFRAYSERLDKFYSTLHGRIETDIPILLQELPDAPAPPVVFGYQMLPRILNSAGVEHGPGASFSYSWPITQGYIQGESAKLDVAEAEMQQTTKTTGVAKAAMMLSLIQSYKSLLDGQRIVDQYIEYNRLWQRTVAENRTRYDEMTKLYKLTQAADAETANAILQILGQPQVPSSIQVVADKENHRVVLHVPIYTDIVSDGFLEQVKGAIESIWQAKDQETSYAVEIEFRKISPAELYENGNPPRRGDAIDIRLHTARFPDGLILTTGTETTDAVVKRYIALGSGDISMHALAHEFGHLLGFSDGYIRGYKDLGEQGFEILEFTPAVDDIMSAPLRGAVTPEHFKRIVDAMNLNNDTSQQQSPEKGEQP